MYLKREGEDIEMIRRIKKNSVCEMLESKIKDDEDMLLKKGRLK
jgi:hypothetical protein